MPYSSMNEVPGQIKMHKGASLTLEQANKMAEMFDAMKKDDKIDSPMAVAWANFEKTHEVQDGKWIARKGASHSEMFSEEVYELKDIEIFSAGKWKGEEYTTDDLDNMVHNFDLLGRKYKAPLKLGHDEKQALAQSDGYPAIGWVKDLKRSGDKLLATFTSVPQKIKQLIDRKAYGRFSSEVLWNFNFGGNMHKRVLRAVALLGADTPAVNSISDILALYSEGDIPCGDVHSYHDLSTEKRKENEDMPTIEELQRQLNEQQHNIAKLSQDLQSREDKIKNLEEEKNKRQAEEQNAKVFSLIDEGIKAGKIAPIQREYLASLACSQTSGERVVKFSDGKEEKFSSPCELLAEMIKKLPINEKFREFSSTVNPNEENKEKVETKVKDGTRVYSTDADIHSRAEAIQKERKCTYTEAFNIAIKEVK